MATYYVSTSGNNGNTGLTQGDPWQTLAYAEANATTPGDVIALKKGDTFTVSSHSITHGGAAGSYITWDGSLWGVGADAIIQITSDHAGIAIVNITGCEYVKFQNITVEGNSHNCYDGIIIGGLDEVTPAGTQNDEQYIYVDGCTVQNIRSAAWSSGIHVQTDHNDISYIFIQNNRITNISNHGIAWYNGKVSDGADGNFATKNSYCGYNTIDLCGRLETGVSSCIMITQDVRDMVCEHNNLTGGGDGDAPGIAVGGASQGVWPTNIIIRYNYINCQSGEQAINFDQGGDITCEVYYNILFSDNISTIEIFASASPNYTNANMRFYNNTIITSTAYGAFKNGCTIVSSATFKNNLCYSTVAGKWSGYVITCNTANNTVHSNNLMYKTEATDCYHALNGATSYYRTTVLTWEATGVITDPTFVTNFTDLHLQAGSPAINAGVDVGLILDYNGYVVPFGLLPDIGCHEYGSSPPPSPPIVSPPVYGYLKIGSINIKISHCTEGIYLRWWFNGWHYFNFQNGYDNSMQTEDMDVQVTRMFSRISKIEHPTKLKADYSYRITLEGITSGNIPGFTQMLLAEKVEQYEDSIWREVDITRGEHLIKDEGTNGYIINFEITRKELPNTPAIYQKSIKLYLSETLCDLDDDEVIPINKQVNDIAEMQDRQSDFTAEFKIRKTRAMKALFELSGEVGIDSSFPYANQTCRLIQSGIEMITNGILILNRVDDQYYYVSILSGNKNFFKDIEKLKLTDLTLGTTIHDWNATDQEDSQDNDRDYLYPLCEPSDDGAIGRYAANLIEMYGGWIWPFIKVKKIWDEIFLNAGYWDTGDILNNDRFLKLWMPISSLKITNTDNYLYSLWNQNYDCPGGIDLPGGTIIKGDAIFATGHYIAPYTATYTFKVYVHVIAPLPVLSLCESGGVVAAFTSVPLNVTESNYEVEYAATVNDDLTVASTMAYFYYYTIAIVKITDAKIGYGSLNITPRLHLPDMTQTEFIKMICNMFGLIPDVSPRDHKIHFWNYSELYDNIQISRDWSAYLSEREDESEFKFGDYAQDNYLRYKDSKDVIKDNGRGDMQIDDETLPVEKNVVDLPISTCDEVTVLSDVNISRIAFNKWDTDTSLYVQEDSIDPRICFMKQASGAKTFAVWDDVPMVNNHFDVAAPKLVCSLEVSFSDLVSNYQGLSRLLTKTNLRRAKFNLPVYEVAGLKHYIPIYLSQYKAYFYVNKVNNYVPGKLCTIDLIKL